MLFTLIYMFRRSGFITGILTMFFFFKNVNGYVFFVQFPVLQVQMIL